MVQSLSTIGQQEFWQKRELEKMLLLMLLQLNSAHQPVASFRNTKGLALPSLGEVVVVATEFCRAVATTTRFNPKPKLSSLPFTAVRAFAKLHRCPFHLQLVGGDVALHQSTAELKEKCLHFCEKIRFFLRKIG